MTEPMTDEQLQQIRKRLGSIIIFPEKAMGDVQMLADTAKVLLAEVERLRRELDTARLDTAYQATLKENCEFQYHRDVPRLEEHVGQLIDERHDLLTRNAAMRELIRRVVDVNGMSEWNRAGLADTARAILAQNEDNTNGK